MFSVSAEIDLRKTIFYMVRIHKFSYSDVLNMSYIDFQVNLSFIKEYIKEEEERYNRQKQGFT